MGIEKSGVVGLLEIDDHELTEKFYEQSKVLIAGSAPPSLRDVSQLYPKGGLSN
jgi:hypothetical protein